MQNDSTIIVCLDTNSFACKLKSFSNAVGIRFLSRFTLQK